MSENWEDSRAWQCTDDGWFISVVFCQRDPVNGGYLIPGGAVTVMPPKDYIEGKELPWWNKSTLAWEIKPDPRQFLPPPIEERVMTLEQKVDKVLEILTRLTS